MIREKGIKKATLDLPRSCLWLAGNAIGVTIAPVVALYLVSWLIGIEAIGGEVCFSVMGLLGLVIMAGTWRLACRGVDRSWRWFLVGFLTWGTITATSVFLTHICDEFIKEAGTVAVGGGWALMMVFFAILLAGYLIVGIVYALTNIVLWLASQTEAEKKANGRQS